MNYVYLAPALGEDRFKIGMSRDPLTRFASLPEKIDTSRTTLIECGTSDIARSLERSLHFMFGEHSMTPHHRDGHTEWFQPCSVMRKIHVFLVGNQPLLKYRSVKYMEPSADPFKDRLVVPGVPRKVVERVLLELGLEVYRKNADKVLEWMRTETTIAAPSQPPMVERPPVESTMVLAPVPVPVVPRNAADLMKPGYIPTILLGEATVMLTDYGRVTRQEVPAVGFTILLALPTNLAGAFKTLDAIRARMGVEGAARILWQAARTALEEPLVHDLATQVNQLFGERIWELHYFLQQRAYLSYAALYSDLAWLSLGMRSGRLPILPDARLEPHDWRALFRNRANLDMDLAVCHTSADPPV